MRLRHFISILSFALVMLLGYWLASTAVMQHEPRKSSAKVSDAPPLPSADESGPRFRNGERGNRMGGDDDAALAGAVEGQRVLVFKDKDALLRFLERAGDRVKLLGRLDALNALRVGFSNYDDLLALLDGEEQQSYIFPVYTPPLPDGKAQSGAVALGNHLLEWLGISTDNSAWGKGVLIAILDTGVTANSAFNTRITSINLVPLPADPTKQNGHGTAVASMIIGNDPLTPGVAPGASILSVRIADDNGVSNSFVLAEGIIAAVDAGAKLINISMGSQYDSLIVRNALAYASEHGAMVVAAAGNNGVNQVSYPAANAGVIPAVAVDAYGNHLDFSNTG
ncbi:MAG: S8 family serine peptidase, partial [Gloeobacteraceae cyanobacterium ES-bin-144]|nr:S8 family serine peptidase [Verrucomicrobiales bacterium]